MKRLISAIMAFALIGTAAIAQNHHGHPHGDNPDKLHAIMFKGLTDKEKGVVGHIHAVFTQESKEAFAKRVNLCFKSDHKELKGKKMDEKAQLAHWLSGLTPEEAKAFKADYTKLSKEEKAVIGKMLKNCCTHGTNENKLKS